MKTTVFIFFVILFAQACKPATDNKSDQVAIKSDTLYTLCNGSDTIKVIIKEGMECFVLYNADTICTNYTFRPAHEIVSSLSALGYPGLFLIQHEAGDGCPQVFQLFYAEPGTKPIVTEQFGNCNSIYVVRMLYPELEFVFEGFDEANRKAVTYNYHINTHVLSIK